MSPRSPEDVIALVQRLRALPHETPWAEFKCNNDRPEDVGEYVSALANSAVLERQPRGFIVWGIDDVTRHVVGTQADPAVRKVGNENFENWLTHLLDPQVAIEFLAGEVEGRCVVVLEVGAASGRPVRFKGEEWIRVGSYKKRLKDHPEKERALWQVFSAIPFEVGSAATRLDASEVLRLLDFQAYFDLLHQPLPADARGILAALEADELARRGETGAWEITNLGGILFAKDLNDFPALRRKTLRLVLYAGTGRVVTVAEQELRRGYACGFEDNIRSIDARIPRNEVIGKALRKSVPMFPELAVREVVANALIHQDFNVSGAGPMVEVFDDRMEVTNPGVPLVPTDRLLDRPPRSRNEKLASLMRRFGICEERGSGIDKVVFQIEVFQLPAPLFEATGDSTRVILFGHRPLKGMEKADRVRACYLHSCLRYVSRQPTTNASVRERFGIPERNMAAASRLLKEAVEAGVIVVQDPSVGWRSRRYLPVWAAPAAGVAPVA